MNSNPAPWQGGELAAGRYQLGESLGLGGMSHVYRAHDRHLGIDVIVKAPRQAMLEDPAFAHRFRQEIRSLVRLNHPHIVDVLDVGQHAETPFAVMRYLSGGTLAERCRDRQGRAMALLPESLNYWLPEIADALDFVHAQGYVHRDVKPDNILFDTHGNPYLSDFGVAKVLFASDVARSKIGQTAKGMVLGTPDYMAPEMILGESFDGRVDQYALAITIYETLAGRRPFLASSGAAMMIKQTEEEPPLLHQVRCDLPEALSQALHRALRKEPKQRYRTCAELAEHVLRGVALVQPSEPLLIVETRDTIAVRSPLMPKTVISEVQPIAQTVPIAVPALGEPPPTGSSQLAVQQASALIDRDNLLALVAVTLLLISIGFVLNAILQQRRQTENNSSEQSSQQSQLSPTRLDSKVASLLRHGDDVLKTGKPSVALEAYSAAVEQDSTCSAAWGRRGSVLLMRSEYDRALLDFTHAIRLAPNHAEWYHQRGLCHHAQGHFLKALGDYERAIHHQPVDPVYRAHRGLTHWKLQAWPQAIADYRHALQLDPQQADWHHMLGLCCLEANRYNQAIEAYHQAIELDPKQPHYYNNRAWCYTKLQEYTWAILDCSRAIELEAQNPRFFENRAFALEAKGEILRAITDYRTALELEPASHFAQAQLQRLTSTSQTAGQPIRRF